MIVFAMVSHKLIAIVLLLQLVINHVSSADSSSSDNDDLMDFAFEKTNVNSAVQANETKRAESLDHFDDAFGEFLDIIDSTTEQGSHIQQKEKRVKDKLVRAWKNPNMQRKFAEVLPILKVMTSHQKIALAALVSAQVGSKQGRELNLDQVKVMFGDRKELILPLVLDIANLVRMAAESNDAAPRSSSSSIKSRTLAVRDQYDSLASAEFHRAEPETQPIAPNLAMHDDRFSVDVDDEPEIMETSEGSSNGESRAFVVTRSAPFYDHLLKMVPNYKPMGPKKQQPILQRRVDAGPPPKPPVTLPLNQKPFLVPSTTEMKVTPESTSAIPMQNSNVSYNEVEDLALNALNGTYVSDSEAMASESRDNEEGDEEEGDDEQLPTAERLIGGRYRKKPYSRYSHRKPSGSSASLCEKFTGSVCLRVEDYPMDQIMGSIRRHKYAMGALLAEYRDKADDTDHIDYSHDFNSAYHRRREDETGQPSPGAMCPSLIRYARPQKARSASGEWKYIVNTGQHTQTLRLEKCSKPQESCTYLTDNFRSRCIQVYNYHRLLSWDKTRGLHVDIFKVPTCCSCRIDGYKEVFPPLNHYQPTSTYHNQQQHHVDDYRPAATNIRTPYSSLHGNHDEDDDEDEDEEDDEEDSVGYQYSNGFKRKKATKVGIDSYLTPPAGKYDTIPFKRGPSTSSLPASPPISPKKRPNRNNNRDLSVAGSRSDTIISPRLPLTTEPVRRTPVVKDNVKKESKATIRHKADRDVSDLELGSSRINYNYHPIIDFFEDGTSSEEEERVPVKEARTGEQAGDWRPMVNGLKSL